MLNANPEAIILSGGEPLVVQEIFLVARRIVNAGSQVILYTSGSAFDTSMVEELMESFSRITVSVDGAKSSTHDRIRGRRGSFTKAVRILFELNNAVSERRKAKMKFPQISIDFVVMQSNFNELYNFCREVVAQFPELSNVSFGSVIPTGLASRSSFAEFELLNEEQIAILRDGQLEKELQSIVNPSIVISITDNKMFQLNPDLIASGINIPPIQVEPDGQVRAMPIYEGVVGSLLEEPLTVLWERAIERWNHPLVVDVLKSAATELAWAKATREIDLFFGSESDRKRIANRPLYERRKT